MTVLITKANEPIVKQYFKNAVFTESTRNTITFKIAPKSFERLRTKVSELGYNPYALFYW